MLSLRGMSSALGLLALSAAASLAQGVAPNRNQATADRVAGALQSEAVRAGSRVEIEARDGLVTLSGVVPSAAVKADLISRAGKIAGVSAVADRLRVAGDSRVRTVQFQPAPMATQPVEAPPTRVALGHHRGGAVYDDGAMMGPVVEGGMPGAAGPMPEGLAGSGGTQAAMPGAPNYAWPSNAPYPNASAVGYPTSYPWQAWPNVGPAHPYPEIPLDWRVVTLRWTDGIWWLDFKKHYSRPFWTPYPFGIWGY